MHRPSRVTGKDVPMPYAANLEKLALPNVDEVVAAAKAGALPIAIWRSSNLKQLGVPPDAQELGGQEILRAFIVDEASA